MSVCCWCETCDSVRFPVGKGIAGFVAETGQPLNVSDVYNDPRFNAEVDEMTGYTTHSIFCQPVIIRGTLIGVIEFVNKNNSTRTFTEASYRKIYLLHSDLSLRRTRFSSRSSEPT